MTTHEVMMFSTLKNLWKTFFSNAPDPVMQKLKIFKDREKLNQIETMLYNEIEGLIDNPPNNIEVKIENSDTRSANPTDGA
jgi:hypothetical protein